MKSFSPELADVIGSPVKTMADCCLMRRADGLELALTAHQFNIPFEGRIYRARAGFMRTAQSDSIGTKVGNVDLNGIIDNDLITSTDIRAGKWRDAEIWMFAIDYTNPAAGPDEHAYGRIGEITLTGKSLWVAELRGLEQFLSGTIGDRYGRTCVEKLGNARCGVILDPPVRPASTDVVVGQVFKGTAYDARRYVVTIGGTTDALEPTWDTTIGNTTSEAGGVEYVTAEAWTKQLTVTAVTDRRTFIDTDRVEPDDWFAHGEVAWLTGENAGITSVVKTNTAVDGRLVLRQPLPFDIQVGDTATVSAGCNHLLKLYDGTYGGDCKVKFDNVVRFRGHPELMGTRRLLSGGGA